MHRNIFLPILQLYFAPKLGKTLKRKILTYFSSLEEFSEAFENAALFKKIFFDIPDAHLETLLGSGNKKLAQEELSRLEKLGLFSNLKILTFLDHDYPPLVRQTHNPSPILFTKGKSVDWKHRVPLAFVGTRTPSDYGMKAVIYLVESLKGLPFVIVSGFARGIDTVAHETALRVGLPTVAFLGTGLGRIYPLENRKLAEKICENGALMTQFSSLAGPEAWHFPERNQMISGSSSGVVVIEAPEKSGSLLTAKFALEQNREVFAVPGPIFSGKSSGCHLLIHQGAKLVYKVENILEELQVSATIDGVRHTINSGSSEMTFRKFGNERGPENTQNVPLEDSHERLDLSEIIAKLDTDEKHLLTFLNLDPLHIDEIVIQTKLHAASVSSLLMSLSIKGLVEEMPGKRFKRI